MNDLALTFPFGFPTDEAYNIAWDAQKSSEEERKTGAPENYVDSIAAYNS
jgi:Xaa-Pro aminopeptidase